MLRRGDRIAPFTLPAADGQTCSLSDLLHGNGYLLLVFLRHLG
jgi:peroxiredoxin